ncbi:MAG: HAMP domain-containing histidine kinase [Marinifilaceae bacterium]|jgi:signal transduction histidine kinase|nr:HAMP domain-containing histidine kinase [Marinifilaceae bacterium]
MKLISKINKTFLIYGLVIFILTDFIIIFIGDYFIQDELDQQLSLKVNEISSHIKKHGTFTNIYPTDISMQIDECIPHKFEHKDTVIYTYAEQQDTPFREYSEVQEIHGRYYLITTRIMKMEYDDVFAIFSSFISISLFFLFVFVLVFTNRMNLVIWRDFNDNLIHLKTFTFNSRQELKLKKTNIYEFDFLNSVLEEMSNRLRREYSDSVEFSANVAHELRTPLAVIQSKCENLFSKQTMKEDDIIEIRNIYTSSQKLSYTINSLLTLSKIDNDLFNKMSNVSVNDLIKSKLKKLNDIISYNELEISIVEKGEFVCLMDLRLAELFVNNLIGNSIKHIEGGKKMEILISDNYFSISNSGLKSLVRPDSVFDFLYKESENKESSGIGLAMVKKIADLYGLESNYRFDDKKHIFYFNKIETP